MHLQPDQLTSSVREEKKLRLPLFCAPILAFSGVGFYNAPHISEAVAFSVLCLWQFVDNCVSFPIFSGDQDGFGKGMLAETATRCN